MVPEQSSQLLRGNVASLKINHCLYKFTCHVLFIYSIYLIYCFQY